MVNAQEVIAQALALSEAATDGPWVTGWDGQQFYVAPASERRNYGARIADWTYVINPGNSADEDECDTRDAAFIAAARTLLPALAKALGDVLDVHAPTEALMNPGRHERLVKVCIGCGTDDGNWQIHPCPTRRAITAALSEVTP